MTSSVSVKVPSRGYVYTFSGVISVRHSLSLKLTTEASAQETVTNGAVRQLNKVTLAVVESDIGHGSGWADRMLQAMEALRNNQLLCDVVTKPKTYKSMLLTDISVTEDEKSQSGWQGTLTFTEYNAAAPAAAAAPSGTILLGGPGGLYNNSSTPTNTGNTGTVETLVLNTLTGRWEQAGISPAGVVTLMDSGMGLLTV